MKNISVHIKGKVYKTGYRFYVKQIAGIFEIKGTVQYLDDHSVFIEAMHTQAILEEFLKLCRIGNISSRIDDFKVEEAKPKLFNSFEIINNTI